ncbi:MAG TPA: cation:proton antiporter [Candidatus Thermoplasmatota archaeon]|nr:cation:proton antiporter [Candidatus Thermoplasmatota archaeon]
MGATILKDLVAVMVLAAAVTILFYRLRQPVVLGYLLAGAMVGPHALRLVSDTSSIDGLAELGLIFLMFSVGLEFDLRKLRKVGAKATMVAAAQVGIMIWLGYEVGRFLGWSMMDSIFLGAVVSISSTVIIVKVLTEMGRLKEEYAELAFGVLIIEDIAAIVMVGVLSALGTTGGFQPAVVGATLGGILLFVLIFLAVGLVLVPRLIERVSKFHVEEVLVTTVVGLAFLSAMLAIHLGFSEALGAFLMGAIIAESKAVRRVEHKIVPIRDLFTSLFFVAVGMMINPFDILSHWQPILLLTGVVVVGKVVSVTAAAFLAGYDGRTAFKTGMAMGQIGEFSFIIAGLGITLGVIRPELHPIAVAVSALTALTSPFLIRIGPAVADAVAPRLPGWYTRALMAYTRFVRAKVAAPSDPLARGDAKRARHGGRVAIYAAWLFGLLIVSAYASQWLGAEVGTALSWGDNAQRSAAVTFLGLAGLPLFVAFAKATEAYAFSAAKAAAMTPSRLTSSESFHRRPKFVSRAVATAAAIVLLGLAVRVAWGVHPLAIPNVWILVPNLLVIGLVGFFGWHKLEGLYLLMERTLDDLMGTDDDALPSDQHQRIRERLPWGMDVEEVHLTPFDRASYASLKSLNLRDRTGATVLSIERGQSVVPNPHPDLVLLPHDRVIIVGKHEHLEKARRYLAAHVERPEPILASDIRIPASSPAVGRPLGELDLSQSGRGARVGLVQKKDGSLVAPSPRVELEADDHIIVYGSESSIDSAVERLRARRWPDPPKAKMGPGGR